ncbi:MAG: hypothetical protein M1839_002727 [Geoglossum umbratile]|nr:MAG: hypothetical protein M1839_002727 [Geoglossum umbratile]
MQPSHSFLTELRTFMPLDCSYNLSADNRLKIPPKPLTLGHSLAGDQNFVRGDVFRDDVAKVLAERSWRGDRVRVVRNDIVGPPEAILERGGGEQRAETATTILRG